MAEVGVERDSGRLAPRRGRPDTSPAKPAAAGARRQVRWLVTALLLAPSLLAGLYLGFIASDRYVSEAQFVIRTAARPVGATGFGSFLQMAGLGRSQDDVFSVQSFLGSRDAVRRLSERLPVRDYYGAPGADFIARYPSIFFGPSQEELHRYLGWMVSTVYSSTTGITTLRVQAFEAEHARRIADTLLELGEQTINRMNERIHGDAARLSHEEVRRNEERLVAAQIAITRFRNDELTIDPASSSVIVTELVARLSAELAQAQTQLREMSTATPDSPILAPLRRRIAALEAQIDAERRKVASEAGGLPAKLAAYERLVLEREFAKSTLATAVRSLETARVEAQRQQLYLERVAQPVAADYPMAPQRLRHFLSVLAANVLLILVVWLVYAGVNERLSEPGHG